MSAVPRKTTTSFNCWLESRIYNFGDSEAIKTVTEVWILQKKTILNSSMNLETDLSTARTENAIPKFGETYINWCTGLNPAQAIYTNEWWDKMYCINFDAILTKEGRVQLTCVFSTRVSMIGDGVGLLRYPFTTEVVGGTRPMEAFRRNPSVAPPTTADISATDIGGAAIIAGSKQGLIIDVPVMKFRFKRVFNSQDSLHGCANIATTYTPLLGNRNSSTFLGGTFPIGTIVLESYNLTKLEGPFYEIAFDCIYDTNSECSQTPKYDKDGTPTLDNTGTNLADVRWTRPTRTGANLNNIFWNNTPGTLDTNQALSAFNGYTPS